MIGGAASRSLPAGESLHSWNLHLGRVSLYSLPAGGVRGQPEPSPPLGIFILPASRGSPWPKGSWRVVPLGLEEGKRRTRGHKVARVLLPNRSQISSLSDSDRLEINFDLLDTTFFLIFSFVRRCTSSVRGLARRPSAARRYKAAKRRSTETRARFASWAAEAPDMQAPGGSWTSSQQAPPAPAKRLVAKEMEAASDVT